jgi:DinB superfamily
MKSRSFVLVTALSLTLCSGFAPALAEDEAASSFHGDVLANLEATGQKLIDLAEATPANMFGWRPNKDVRTVSEVYMHVVGTNLLLPPALGAAPPEGVEMGPNVFGLMKEWEETVTSKEAVIAKLKESLAYAAKAVAAVEDLDTQVQLFGPPQSKRAYILILLSHAHEHLGQSIAYARSFGVAPPWSRPLPSGDGGE